MTGSRVAGPLGDFIRRLVDTYRESSAEDAARDRTLLTLTLSLTLLDELRLRPWDAACPLQVAVIGPTQAGKSTVVNLLLGQPRAEASPLAAFTRALKGFVTSADAAHADWMRQVLGHRGVALESVEGVEGPAVVIWDTPDFDSHRSHDYRTLIAGVGGLADVLVLVVSKEKYADLSVWETLDALRPLARRLVVCLNKVSADAEVLASAVHERLRDSGWGGTEIPVLVLPYTPQPDAYRALSGTEEAAALRRLALTPDQRCDRSCRLRGLCAVLERNWSDWLNPIQAEHGAERDWRREVDQRIDSCLATYEEQYLDHASHNVAFKQAVLQLLELLEIPALAGPLTRARNVLTWPLRRLTGLFDERLREGSGGAEAVILKDVMAHALLSLRPVILNGAEDPGQTGAWWRSLNRSYAQAADEIQTTFDDAVREYQAAFEPEIKRAAHSLFERLQENPVLLNTLRASRVGADAAGVVFAVNTGTVGVADALLTPAMLSLTSMLTESAVGQYMESVRDKLLERQRALVREMFETGARQALLDTPRRDPDAALFMVNGADLAEAERLRGEICR